MSNTSRSAILLLSMLACLAPTTQAQPQCGWKLRSPQAVSGHAMVYDAARQQTVIFGGALLGGLEATRADETVIWDGARWNVLLPTVRPSARAWHAMCYDSSRQEVLLFGGSSGTSPLRDTWTWNGEAWQQVGTDGPNLPTGIAMAFDTARGVAVLCGRSADSTQLQTWEWNGSLWSLRTTLGVPPSSSVAMVYDANRAVCVLYGYNIGTYEWNGLAWAQRTSGGPPSRWGAALTYDSARGVTVLFGGYVNAERQDTWEWDGSTWTQRANVGPNRRASHAMAFDSVRGVAVMFGGYREAGTAATTLTSDLWEWDGAVWVRRTDGIPQAASNVAMAFDSARNIIVMVRPASASETDANVRMQTWEWDGAFWHRRFTTNSPRSSTDFQMTFDTVRAQTLLYIGNLFEFWAFDGTDWTLLRDHTDGGLPHVSASYTPPMAFDAERGIALTGSSGRWWGWDGANWTVVSDAVFSAGYACMAFDQSRRLIVLYGWGPNIGQTFEWDGATWSFRGQGGPSAWKSCSLAYNSARHVSVLFGGRDLTPLYRYWNEVWEWDGDAWTPRMAGGPAARAEAAMAYDSIRGKFVLFGGRSINAFGDTWEWDGVAPVSIRTPPQSQIAVLGESAEFTSIVWGSDPMTLRWRRNGVPLSDGMAPSGSVLSGTDTATLRIDAIGPSDVGTYDVVATNPCGEVVSATAQLTVTRAECAGDLDGSGIVELPDLAILLSQFGCHTADVGCTADIDVDGSVGLSDLAVLLATFGTPCS